ncbi:MULTISPECIES: imidazoleglycerol-phosphate dehydratase HisB [unclassified Candidatus Paralachnospira]|uniref:imidazoleglycerol-phosphate dehydratase HisB n=1 Tax=unclassified Candidatus Paralachnospira TaxID=3099471 RepID=UPI003F934EDF
MRSAQIERNTNETKIRLSLNLDGTGKSICRTGIGFLDHMLTLFAKHGLFDLEVEINGDLEVDTHHSIEDCGIVLGQAIKEAAGDKMGIRRYGTCILPMDEVLMLCSLDLSGRPYFVSNARFQAERVGTFETEMVHEFFYAVSYAAAMNLHFEEFHGENTHHVIEAMFKAFSKALDSAVYVDERIPGLLSTKGSL